jgi:Ca2+-binding RTX toxin-like protein
MSDIPNNNTTNATLSVGGTFSSNIGFDGDRDWVRIDLDPGEYVSVAMNGTGLADPFLRVYDAGGNLVALNDDGGSGLNSLAVFGSAAGGTFYVEAGSFDDTGTGNYQLSATAAPAPVPIDALDSGNARTDTDISVYFVPAGQSGNFNDGNPNDDSDEVVSEGWTQFEIDRFMAALASIEAVTNVTFTQTSDPNADFQLVLDDNELLASDGAGLLGYFYLPNASGQSLGVFNGSGFGWDDDGLAVGGLGYSTIVHEVLHGLGLEHPHDGNNIMSGVTSAFGDFGDFNLNQGIFSTMSYNGGLSGSFRNNDQGNEAGPMALDIAAIQALYGVNNATASGDSVYDLDDNNGDGAAWQSIWDGGGTDTMRYNGNRDTVIDLREATLEYEVGGGGFVSRADGIRGGFTIANGANIENAIGGHGDDEIIGNEMGNDLSGRGGDDSLIAGGGSDTVAGNSGSDEIAGTSGTNTLYGGSGSDEINGGSGVDTIFGGSGNDEINGGSSADFLFGGRGNDDISGGGGDDQITGGMGADELTGDAGADDFIFEFVSDSYVRSNNRDTITDFETGIDEIDLSIIGGISASDITLVDAGGGNTTVLIDADDVVGDDMEIFVFGTVLAGDFIL